MFLNLFATIILTIIIVILFTNTANTSNSGSTSRKKKSGEPPLDYFTCDHEVEKFKRFELDYYYRCKIGTKRFGGFQECPKTFAGKPTPCKLYDSMDKDCKNYAEMYNAVCVPQGLLRCEPKTRYKPKLYEFSE